MMIQIPMHSDLDHSFPGVIDHLELRFYLSCFFGSCESLWVDDALRMAFS